MPCICIFIAFPSYIFYCVETDWTYLDSVYYVVVSLCAIGFGDLVNAHHGPEAHERLGGWLVVYQVFVMIWILHGLAFFVMTFSAIAENFKKLAKNARRELGRHQLKFIIRIFKKLAKKRVNFAVHKTRQA